VDKPQKIRRGYALACAPGASMMSRPGRETRLAPRRGLSSAVCPRGSVLVAGQIKGDDQNGAPMQDEGGVRRMSHHGPRIGKNMNRSCAYSAAPASADGIDVVARRRLDFRTRFIVVHAAPTTPGFSRGSMRAIALMNQCVEAAQATGARRRLGLVMKLASLCPADHQGRSAAKLGR